jgi:6-phosphofructokinase 1
MLQKKGKTGGCGGFFRLRFLVNRLEFGHRFGGVLVAFPRRFGLNVLSFCPVGEEIRCREEHRFMSTYKGTIGILTGGGDVPGLNPAIRAVTIRALREGYRVLGLRCGWAGLTDIIPDPKANNSAHYSVLTEDLVNRAGRTGGTFLHTSRTRPSHLPKARVPEHLADRYTDEINDITPEIIKNLEFLGIDYLIPIGGDDTLSYAHRLHQEGVKVIAIPKTMDNDVPGTDYCIGFGTCVTRTIELTHTFRTTAGSHERFLVIEVFGRYAGYTALLPTMAGAADRCVIPEHPFSVDQLCELLVYDRNRNPSKYSVVLVSEGATFAGDDAMSFESDEADMFGHKKLGGIGDKVAARLKDISPKYNHGRRINVVNQRLSYLVRCGDPDAMDSIVPMAFGNLALDLVLEGVSGRLVCLRNGIYDSVPVEVIVGTKKVIDAGKHYDTLRYRPTYKSFARQPTFIMTGDY